ncbi:hypothetical protein ACIP5Z_02150 [Rothia terrae]|uniref:hypothetical protein n=1 Tax=Rothia terrae TaxID=396015 RepID=UPI0037F9DB03
MAQNNLTTKLAQTVLSSAGMQGRLVSAMMQALAEIWGSFDGWYDDDGVEQAAQLAVDAEKKVLEQVKALAESTMQALMLQTGQALKAETPQPFEYPRGIDPLEVWKRPAEQYRYAVSVGETEQDALLAALDRVDHIANTDAQLTRRDAQVRQLRRSDKVIGYRRIIHPELSKSGVCGLCIVAADRIYKVDDLMPIHDGCNCDVAPVTKANDPGLSLNQDDLKKLYSDAGESTAAKDLKNIRVTSYEHGELGPVLIRAGDKYLTEDEAKTRKRARKPKVAVVDTNSLRYLRQKEDRTKHDLNRLIGNARTQHEAYQRRIQELRDSGMSADNPKILGMIFARRRMEQELKKYSKELEKVA